MRLSTRVALIGVGVLAATLVVVAAVTFEIVRVTGRQRVDRALRDEQAVLATTFSALLGEPDVVDRASLARAAEQYLALHPGTSRHLTVLRFDGDSFTTRDGPDRLLELHEDGELPVGTPGRLTTESTGDGTARVLNAPLVAGGDVVGEAIIVGPLDGVNDDAADTLVRIAVAGVAGLILGGAALAITTRRALRPVAELAAAARVAGRPGLEARVPEPARRDEVGELAAEINRMLDRISANDEQRRRLLSAVSHELRTPLAVARGHVEMFETLDLDAGRGAPSATAQADLVEVLRGELDRLALVADDLEAVVQGGVGSSVELGPVFVPDVLDELRHRLAGLGVTDVALGDAPAVVVDADQHRLAQALLNLVVNAVTHTPPHTAVSVAASVDGDQLRLDVVDDGPGIDPAIRHRVFEPFVTTRADGSSTGRGLGLAVVRSLVEAQRGSVGIVTGSAGTTATVRLPIAPDGSDAASISEG